MAFSQNLGPQSNIDDARTAISGLLTAFMAKDPPEIIGSWYDEALTQAIVACPKCHTDESLRLIPNADGSIACECLSGKAGCSKRAVEKVVQSAFSEGGYNLTIRQRKARPSRAEAKKAAAAVPQAWEWEQNESGDARRLIWRHGKQILIADIAGEYGAPYVLNRRNGIWENNPNRFLQINKDTAKAAALEMAAMQQDGLKTPHESADFQRWALRSQTTAKAAEVGRQILSEYVELCSIANRKGERLPDIGDFCKQDELDADTRYIGAANGIIDLDTAALVPPDEGKDLRITRSTGVKYDPGATHEYITKLLAHLDDTDAGYILNAAGYSLRGNPARRIYLLVGPGGSGKTTFLNALMGALGEGKANGYGLGLVEGALTADKYNSGNSHKDHLVGFHEARIATSNELRSGGGRLNESLLKDLSGGGGMEIRQMKKTGSGGAKKQAKATLFIACNENALDAINLSDPALADRLAILRWPAFPPNGDIDADRYKDVQRKGPAEAMLAELVRRAKANKAPPPHIKSVRDAVAERRAESIGVLGEWLQERIQITRDPYVHCTTDQIWAAAFQEIGGADGLIGEIDRKGFPRRLRDAIPGLPTQRVKKIEGKNKKAFVGVRLLTAEEAAAEAAADAAEEVEVCQKCGGAPTGVELSANGWCGHCVLAALEIPEDGGRAAGGILHQIESAYFAESELYHAAVQRGDDAAAEAAWARVDALGRRLDFAKDMEAQAGFPW